MAEDQAASLSSMANFFPNVKASGIFQAYMHANMQATDCHPKLSTGSSGIEYGTEEGNIVLSLPLEQHAAQQANATACMQICRPCITMPNAGWQAKTVHTHSRMLVMI